VLVEVFAGVLMHASLRVGQATVSQTLRIR
jgi:hypothetical protein